jgi:glycosyltransferase involved in cell wall biosynthesis
VIPHGPVKVLVFQNRFRLGGQERQTILNVRTMDRSRYVPVVAALHMDGEHLADLALDGIKPVVFDVGGSMLRPNTALLVGRLARFLRANGIALVHAQDLYTNVIGAAAARLAGVPCVVTRVDLNHAVTGIKRPVLSWVSRMADRVLVNAVCIRDMAIREGVEPDRIVVVRNGIDLAEFDRAAAQDPEPPAPEPGAVVSVANMHHPVKGQTDLLMAMKEVARVRPDAHLVLVGDGLRRPHLERSARQLGIADRCHFVGHRLDAPAILARAAIGVSSSYAEGISNAILEAMAARLPMVATAAGGTPELVRDGVNGYLVPPGAPAAMARGILELLARPQLRRRMGERGRRVVERDFGVAQMRTSYDALYQELTGLKVPRIMYGAA